MAFFSSLDTLCKRVFFKLICGWSILKAIVFKLARRLALSVIPLSLCGMVVVTAHAQDRYPILPCDSVVADKERETAREAAKSNVATQLVAAGITDTYFQTRVVTQLGDRVIDLSAITANDEAKMLQKGSGVTDAALAKLLARRAAIPVANGVLFSTTKPSQFRDFHPETLNVIGAVADKSGADFITRNQLSQFGMLDRRIKSGLEPLSRVSGQLPLSSYAAITATGSIINQSSEREKLFDGTGLSSIGRYGPPRELDIGQVVSRNLGLVRNCTMCTGGAPNEGNGALLDNIEISKKNQNRFIPRPPATTDAFGSGAGAESSAARNQACETAFFAVRDAIKTFNGPNDENKKPFAALDSLFIWMQMATVSQLQHPAHKPLVTLALNYVDRCQAKVQRLPPGAPNDVTTFVGAIGAPFSVGKPIPSRRICTGTLIAKDAVLTARHCFTPPDKNGVANLFSPEEIREHWFELDSGEPFRYQVCGVVRPKLDAQPQQYYSPTTDWIVVQIAEPKGERAAHYKLTPADIHMEDRLLLPGVNIALPQNVVTPPLTTTEVTGCRVMAVSDSCVFHNCQTASGMSGAPVFLKPTNAGDALQLLGIHLGAHGEKEMIATRCGDAPGKSSSMGVQGVRNMLLRADTFLNQP